MRHRKGREILRERKTRQKEKGNRSRKKKNKEKNSKRKGRKGRHEREDKRRQNRNKRERKNRKKKTEKKKEKEEIGASTQKRKQQQHHRLPPHNATNAIVKLASLSLPHPPSPAPFSANELLRANVLGSDQRQPRLKCLAGSDPILLEKSMLGRHQPNPSFGPILSQCSFGPTLTQFLLGRSRPNFLLLYQGELNPYNWAKLIPL